MAIGSIPSCDFMANIRTLTLVEARCAKYLHPFAEFRRGLVPFLPVCFARLEHLRCCCNPVLVIGGLQAWDQVVEKPRSFLAAALPNPLWIEEEMLPLGEVLRED